MAVYVWVSVFAFAFAFAPALALCFPYGLTLETGTSAGASHEEQPDSRPLHPLAFLIIDPSTLVFCACSSLTLFLRGGYSPSPLSLTSTLSHFGSSHRHLPPAVHVTVHLNCVLERDLGLRRGCGGLRLGRFDHAAFYWQDAATITTKCFCLARLGIERASSPGA